MDDLFIIRADRNDCGLFSVLLLSLHENPEYTSVFIREVGLMELLDVVFYTVTIQITCPLLVT